MERAARPLARRAAEGFTPLPRTLLDALLCLPLAKRELLVLLLVARLTYGCRGRAWAALRQADLRAVGVGPNHAKEVLDALLSRGLLERGGGGYRCRVPGLEVGDPARRDRLRVLVGRNLAAAPGGGLPFPFRERPVPGPGTPGFPTGEPTASPSGNSPDAARWRFSRSEGRFVEAGPGLIDIKEIQEGRPTPPGAPGAGPPGVPPLQIEDGARA